MRRAMTTAAAAVSLLFGGCAGQQATRRDPGIASRAVAGGEDVRAAAAAPAPAPELKVPVSPPPAKFRKYVDPELGFEIARPEGSWQLDASDESSSEGLRIPVVLRHRDSGAQVVLQVAPAIATPAQFAERLTHGLRNHPGFVASDPEPIPLNDSSVGFDFSMGDQIVGKVAVVDGGDGQVFVMMATWPAMVSKHVPEGVATIFASVKAIPRS